MYTYNFVILFRLLEAKTISWYNQLSCELISLLIDPTERLGMISPNLK